jgi:biopolymer transport protein ExbD
MTPKLLSHSPRVRIPNLAPMVDVVMVILIFFMLGTGFATPEGVLPTRLPTQVGPGGGARVSVVPIVRIELRDSPEGLRILVMGQALAESSFEALTSLLTDRKNAGADAAGRVLLWSAPAVRFENVISAMDACNRAGFPNLELVIGGGSSPVRAAES